MTKREKTFVQLPPAICPFCRKPKKVMPSGLFELHTVVGKWKKSMCRGSGVKARKDFQSK
jgi:hypothetical protein